MSFFYRRKLAFSLILKGTLFMLYLLVVSIIWAVSFGLVKATLSGLDPHFLAFARLACAIPIFIPLFSKKGLTAFLSMKLLFIGAMQYGVCYLAYMSAYQYLNGHQVALFAILMPLYIVLINNLFERKFPLYPLLLALLAVVGAGVIKYDGLNWANLITGFLIMQIANISFAIGEILYRRLRKVHTELIDRKIYALVFLGGVIITALATSLYGNWKTPLTMTLTQWQALIFLGVFSTALGFFWWNKGAVTTKIATLAVFHNLKVPLGILAALTLFGETSNIPRLLLGGAILFIATYLAQKTEKKTA